MNIEKYFNLAKNISEMSDYTKKNIKIGSVLIYKNKVIANGYNTDKTNPLQMKYNKYRELHNKDSNRNYIADSHTPCIHSEMKCLIDTKDLDIDWSKVSIFIYRESCGKLRNCFPCRACQKALKDRGIKNIFYTNENGYNYERWE